MFKKIDRESLPPVLREQRNSIISNNRAVNQNETMCSVVSLADQKKERQRALLLEKLRKDGFLD